MRLSHTLIIAGALLGATPALAQDNAAAPANTAATTNTMDANAAAQMDMNSAAVPPESYNASPAVATPGDTGTTMAVPTKRGFPWGVLGLLGLLGLMGVRKAKS